VCNEEAEGGVSISEHSLVIVGPQGARRVEWTVQKFAEVEQVNPKTVRRWISKGALVTRRTPGGRIRILGTR
jgi:hypothetical protein